MKKIAILATLMLLAPPMIAADNPCNPGTGGTILSCITHFKQRIFQLELENQALKAENQAQRDEIQALKLRLSLSDGLVAHYPFEGNANDVSGHGHHGTVHGSLGYVTGKMGQAAKFDGINDYVEVANSPSLELNRQLTISYVIAPQSQPDKGRAVPVVVKGRHVGNNYSSWISSLLDYVLFQQYPIPPYSSVPQYTFGDSTTLVANEFVRLTMLRNGSQVKIYLNCQLLFKYEANYDANEKHEPLFIGYDGGYGYRKFKGVLDDLRIYNRAFSESEIQQLAGGCR